MAKKTFDHLEGANGPRDQLPDNVAAEHARRVSGMFDRIANWYDFMNHFLSLGQDYYWRYRMSRLVRVGDTGRVLDLAAGTMDVSIATMKRQPHARVAALDFSFAMLQRGASKVPAPLASHVWPACADGRSLPLRDACVDTVTIAFGIRNIRPRKPAFEEMYRVLRPGGRVVVLEFGTGKQRIWGGLYNFYLNRLLPRLGEMIASEDWGYQHLADTINDFPWPRDLAAELTRVGFSGVYWQKLMSGIVYLHVAKKPE